MQLQFDEFHTPEITNVRSIPYSWYFGEMDLTKEQKTLRIEESEEFENMMMFIFSLFAIMQENRLVNRDFIVEQLKGRYLEITRSFMDVDDYLTAYTQDFARETVGTMIENTDAYYTSHDRAVTIAENEANTNFNYTEWKSAVRSGKRKKIWRTKKDKKVRHTHQEVDGKIKNIEDAFMVGNSLMNFPKDNTFGADPEEIINCRCTIKYF